MVEIQIHLIIVPGRCRRSTAFIISYFIVTLARIFSWNPPVNLTMNCGFSILIMSELKGVELTVDRFAKEYEWIGMRVNEDNLTWCCRSGGCCSFKVSQAQVRRWIVCRPPGGATQKMQHHRRSHRETTVWFFLSAVYVTFMEIDDTI